MTRTSLHIGIGMLVAAGCAVAHAAEDAVPGLQGLQEEWAPVRYQPPKGQQVAGYEAHIGRLQHLIQEHAGRPEPQIWKAIVLSTEAGAMGGFGALDKVKSARDLLLEAERMDPTALQGSAYTSLGSLYYQVPAWPIGFGDDDKAGDYLRKALAVNPDGIDPNYFYADYLREEKRYAEALRHARKALAAPARPGRPIADEGRRAEAQALVERLEQLTASR